jgi:hypothetical protein
MIIHDNNIIIINNNINIINNNNNINIHSNTYSLRNLDVLLLLLFEILRSRSDIVFLAGELADFLKFII